MSVYYRHLTCFNRWQLYFSSKLNVSVYYRHLTCFNRWQLYFSSKFNVSQCDKSLSPGFIPINTWQQRAATPLKPLKDIVCKLRYIIANVLWRNDQTISISIKYSPLSYQTGGNRKCSQQSMNVDHRLLETVFSIAIFRQSGDKRQAKALFLAILDPRSSIYLTFSIAALWSVYLGLLNT